MDKEYLHFYNKVLGTGVSPTTISIYHALLKYANRKTWSCFPSVKTLMRDTGFCERAVRKHLLILEKEGLILKIPRTRDNNGNTSNMYFFN